MISINRVPVPNQPNIFEEIIKIWAKRYYEDPLTIILCFIAKNSDIATSSVLKMAKELVKNDSRTLGMLTISIKKNIEYPHTP